MKLMVLTAAVWPTKEEALRKLWIFLRSCDKFGADPHLYGVGHSFPGYRAMKLDLQLKYLRSQASDYTHVLYTDGWDAMFAQPLDAAIRIYNAMGAPPILASASIWLGNESHEQENYPGCFDHSITYKYPCVGGYMAEISAIIEAFERMMKLPRQTGDDCFNWYDGWKEGWFRPALDNQCRIFQVEDPHTKLLPIAGTVRLCNIETGTLPCILHCSGGYCDPKTGKDSRLIPIARALGIIE
jgi:hypothetical protein